MVIIFACLYFCWFVVICCVLMLLCCSLLFTVGGCLVMYICCGVVVGAWLRSLFVVDVIHVGVVWLTVICLLVG